MMDSRRDLLVLVTLSRPDFQRFDSYYRELLGKGIGDDPVGGEVLGEIDAAFQALVRPVVAAPGTAAVDRLGRLSLAFGDLPPVTEPIPDLLDRVQQLAEALLDCLPSVPDLQRLVAAYDTRHDAGAFRIGFERLATALGVRWSPYLRYLLHEGPLMQTGLTVPEATSAYGFLAVNARLAGQPASALRNAMLLAGHGIAARRIHARGTGPTRRHAAVVVQVAPTDQPHDVVLDPALNRGPMPVDDWIELIDADPGTVTYSPGRPPVASVADVVRQLRGPRRDGIGAPSVWVDGGLLVTDLLASTVDRRRLIELGRRWVEPASRFTVVLDVGPELLESGLDAATSDGLVRVIRNASLPVVVVVTGDVGEDGDGLVDALADEFVTDDVGPLVVRIGATPAGHRVMALVDAHEAVSVFASWAAAAVADSDVAADTVVLVRGWTDDTAVNDVIADLARREVLPAGGAEGAAAAGPRVVLWRGRDDEDLEAQVSVLQGWADRDGVSLHATIAKPGWSVEWGRFRPGRDVLDLDALPSS